MSFCNSVVFTKLVTCLYEKTPFYHRSVILMWRHEISFVFQCYQLIFHYNFIYKAISCLSKIVLNTNNDTKAVKLLEIFTGNTDHQTYNKKSSPRRKLSQQMAALCNCHCGFVHGLWQFCSIAKTFKISNEYLLIFINEYCSTS